MPNFCIKESSVLLDTCNQFYVLTINDLPQNERPREKLLALGADALSSSELLSIVLNTGTRKEGVKQMTERILKEYGEKSIAEHRDPKKLCQEAKLPLAKACQITACFELGRRFFKNPPGRPVFIRSARQAFAHLKNMGDLSKEHLRALYLNSRYRLIHDEVISVGSLTANIIHPREVFRPAVEFGAAALILAHNHPSGSLKPSESDIAVTEQLVKAGRALGIEILDHVIIAANGYVSILKK